MTIHPQLVNISPEIILILQNMLIYALFIDCRESHLRTFCRQIHQCARIGGWGERQFWKCQDFGTVWHWNPSLKILTSFAVAGIPISWTFPLLPAWSRLNRFFSRIYQIRSILHRCVSSCASSEFSVSRKSFHILNKQLVACFGAVSGDYSKQFCHQMLFHIPYSNEISHWYDSSCEWLDFVGAAISLSETLSPPACNFDLTTLKIFHCFRYANAGGIGLVWFTTTGYDPF